MAEIEPLHAPEEHEPEEGGGIELEDHGEHEEEGGEGEAEPEELNAPEQYALEVLNGDFMTLSVEGENLVAVDANTYYFPPNMPLNYAAGKPHAMRMQDVERFVGLNYIALRRVGVEDPAARELSLLRLLCVKNGLVGHRFSPAEFFVRYKETAVLSVDEFAAFNAGDTATAIGEERDIQAIGYVVVTDDNGKNLKRVRDIFPDLVCCVAWFFRARGHHYLNGSDEKYNALWGKCLHVPGDKVSSWENIATKGLHAIYPVLLDAFWKYCVDEQKCAGALIKRYDTAAAGAAVVGVLLRAIEDISLVFPGFTDQVHDSYVVLQEANAKIQENRWNGSVNARYYGARRRIINENQVGPLAAAVRSIYDALAHDSPLLGSAALLRVANIAPVTGAVIGNAAQRAVRDQTITTALIKKG